MCDDFARRIQFVHAARQFAQWNQLPFQIADLVFVGFAHIENEKIVATVQSRLQFAWRDFRDLDVRGGSFFATHAAELVVIDKLMNGAILAAHRALGILAQFEFAEAHSQRVKQEQSANQTIAAAENQFDRFHSLNRADDSWQNAEHSALSAGRHQAGRRRLGIEAAVARTVRHAEDRDLPLEPKNGAVHIGLAKKDASVVDKIAGRKIVRAIHDNVVVLEEFERIHAGQLRFDGFNLNVRVEIRKPRASGLALRLAHVAGAKSDLALKIGEIHDVEINEAQLADARSGKIQTERGTQPTCSNE